MKIPPSWFFCWNRNTNLLVGLYRSLVHEIVPYQMAAIDIIMVLAIVLVLTGCTGEIEFRIDEFRHDPHTGQPVGILESVGRIA